MTKRLAPFDPEEVRSLNAYQGSGVMHEFTCPQRSPLRATTEGWVCDCCDYTQFWAWEVMADWSWDATRTRKQAPVNVGNIVRDRDVQVEVSLRTTADTVKIAVAIGEALRGLGVQGFSVGTSVRERG